MGTLEVHGEGLRALTGQCSVSAARLAGQVPTAVIGPSAQATAAAVSNAYTSGSTAAALAARVEATAHKLTVSAARYVSTDENSAQHLSALCGAPVQV
jgi:hypothetical protein